MLKVKSFLLSLLIFLSVLSWAIANTGGQAATKVYVDPAIRTANPDETFTVDVKIANVEDLWDYEFRLSWDPALLDLTRVTEGSFLNAEDTYSTFFVKKEDFPSVGNLYVVCTLMGELVSVAASGSGTLATVEFLVLDAGNCNLDLHGTLFEQPPPKQLEIEHTIEDGFFKYPISKIRVDPSSIIDPSLTRGDTFNVSVGVTMAVEVYAWSVNMSWDPIVLNVTEIEEGPLLKQNGTTSFASKISQEEGYLYANCTLLGEPPEASVSGSGTLITVTYMVKTKGTTVLDISEATLLDYGGVEVSALTEDGYFSSISGGEIAIISVSASPSRVRAGDSVIVSIVAKNEGDINFSQSVDVTIYYNESFLGTLGISNLNPGGEKTLSFSWSTEDLAEGNYTIEAVASQLLGETNTANNRYVYEYLVVMPPEQSFPLMLIITIFVVVLLVVFAGFVLLKKRV
jgi:hypothetical protein